MAVNCLLLLAADAASSPLGEIVRYAKRSPLSPLHFLRGTKQPEQWGVGSVDAI